MLHYTVSNMCLLLVPPQKVPVFRGPSHVLGSQNSHATATRKSPTGQSSCFKWYIIVIITCMFCCFMPVFYWYVFHPLSTFSNTFDMKQVIFWILVVSSKPGHSTEADAPSGSSVKTLKRTFSLLQSTTHSESSVGSAIPVHQIISLVSMTSPRTFRPHRVSSSPAFVEFDMSESGYGWVLVLLGLCSSPSVSNRLDD